MHNKCVETLLSENVFVACVERQPIYQSKPAKIKFFFTNASRYIRHIFPPSIVLVVPLLAEYHLKCMFKEPFIKHSHQFLNVPSHECHSYKVDYGSSILSGLVVKLYSRK